MPLQYVHEGLVVPEIWKVFVDIHHIIYSDQEGCTRLISRPKLCFPWLLPFFFTARLRWVVWIENYIMLIYFRSSWSWTFWFCLVMWNEQCIVLVSPIITVPDLSNYIRSKQTKDSSPSVSVFITETIGEKLFFIAFITIGTRRFPIWVFIIWGGLNAFWLRFRNMPVSCISWVWLEQGKFVVLVNCLYILMLRYMIHCFEVIAKKVTKISYYVKVSCILQGFEADKKIWKSTVILS